MHLINNSLYPYKILSSSSKKKIDLTNINPLVSIRKKISASPKSSKTSWSTPSHRLKALTDESMLQTATLHREQENKMLRSVFCVFTNNYLLCNIFQRLTQHPQTNTILARFLRLHCFPSYNNKKWKTPKSSILSCFQSTNS